MAPRKQWAENCLSKWEGFTQTGMRMHGCKEAHEDMMMTEHVFLFFSQCVQDYAS